MTKEAFPLKGSSRRRLPFLCGGQKIPSRKLIKLFPSSSFFVTSSRKVGFAMPIKRGEGGTEKERERDLAGYRGIKISLPLPFFFLPNSERLLQLHGKKGTVVCRARLVLLLARTQLAVSQKRKIRGKGRFAVTERCPIPFYFAGKKGNGTSFCRPFGK